MSGKVNLGKLFLLLCIPLAFIAIYFFATRKNGHVACNDIVVKMRSKSERPLLSEADIFKFLGYTEGKKALVGKYPEDLKMNLLEKKLLKQKTIKKAEIYMDLKGEMTIDVTERNPIIRVIPNGSKGYYLCDDKVKIPLSKNFTPDLIPATGFMNDKIDRKLNSVIGFVNNNSFWKEQIEQFFVDEKGDISFIPLTGVHEVILGDTSNLDEKFIKLEIFYKKGLSKIGWDKYKSVNLKYKGQVICK